MDKTIYTLKLGGNDVTLKFNIGTLRRIKEITGKDPLAALQNADTMGALDFAQVAIEAGMKANDKNADVSKVQDWFDELSPDEATNVIHAFTRAYTPDSASQEGSADTQQ